jgi:hypothetical protein
MTSSALSTQTGSADLAFLHDSGAFEHTWRVAKAFSQSGMVPAAYQGKPEACMVALMYAAQLGENPMLVFQEMAPIKGRPTTSARFAIARANKSGLLRGTITWSSKGSGEGLEVTASAVLAATGETISVPVSMAEAKADGWTQNPKYRSIPEQMLRWRSATRLISLYLPEVLFGLAVREEIQVERVNVQEVPATSGVELVAQLNEQISAAPEPTPAPRRRAAPAVEPTPVEPEPLPIGTTTEAQGYLEEVE